MGETFLSVEDIARQLNVDPRSIRRAIRERRLTAYRVNKEYRIDPADFEAYKRSIRTEANKGDLVEV